MQRADSEHILLVDDTRASREGVARILNRAGYRVTEASSGLAALECLRESWPQLVLLDVVLPDIPGPEVLRRIRAQGKTDPIAIVLISSQRIGPEEQAEGLDAGADGYIARPLPNRELLARVRMHLRQRELIEQLQRSEERFHQLIARQADAVLVVDESGTIRYSNTAASALFGKPETELVGSALGHPMKKGGQAELEIQRPDGQLAIAEMQVTDTLWNDVPASIVSFHDITERKRSEHLLHVQSSALEASANAIVITDSEGIIEWANAAFSEASGYGLEFARGKRPADLLKSGVQDRAFYERLWATIQSGQVWRGEIVNRRKDGELRTEEMTITPVHDEQRRITHYIAVKQDITERLALEKQLRRTQRLNSLGQLTGGIAHDFNNLLTVILGSADLLAIQLRDDPQRLELAEMIASGAQRGAELTQRLLAFARKQPLDPREVDLRQLLTDTEDLLRRTLGEDIEFEQIATPDLCHVMIDPSQLENAVLNLCINARDAMPGGGKLRLEAENVMLDSDYTSKHAEVQAGAYVKLTISDTGAGIPRQVLERVFEPFFTTKKPGEGTGLGLAMVYGFVKQSGGHVTIGSKLGKGTTVRLYLPCIDGPAQPVASRAAENEAGPGGTETVLLVEDDDLVRRFALDGLVQLGYTVIAASHGKAALEIVVERSDIDLLFTDVVMPGGMSGQQLADAAKQLRPDLKVLYTSGYAEDVIVHEGRLDRGVKLLVKPYRQTDLARMLREVLDDQS